MVSTWLTLKPKNGFPPAVYTLQPASQRLLFMIWLERHVCPLSPSCGIRMQRNHAQGQVVPLPSPLSVSFFDFSILFPLLLCFGCCVLQCQVSLSLVRSFPCEFKLVTQLGRGTFLLCLDVVVYRITCFSCKHLTTSGINTIFVMLVTQEEKVPQVCLTRIAWTEIEKAG